MKVQALKNFFAAAAILFSCAAIVRSDNPCGTGADERLSPYFLIEGDSESVEQFPLLKTEATVNIAGMCSEVELVQVYKNNGRKTIEAVYVFPMGTRAAIHAMKMKIGRRIIEAQIDETEKARATYNAAKDSGRTASLLEQKRPNVFQMNVANIMPGDIIEVLVKYTEILVPERGTYQFVFPTVVGPRFTGESSPDELRKKDNWVATPYLPEKAEAPYDFDIKVNVKSGIPISKVWSDSHKIEVHASDSRESTILLAQGQGKSGNRDFILNYSLKGDSIETGLLLYPSGEENHFLLMLEPPKKVSADMVPPREYLFIVDVSGSMHGFPLDVSKTLISGVLDNLKTGDYFNVLFFSGGSNVLSPYPLPATAENKDRALRMLSSAQAGGGTEILAALKKAMALEKKEGMSRIIITATDGYVSVEKETFDLIRNNLGNANFFAFGIGSSVNRLLIEGMARAGKGEPFVVTNTGEAKAVAGKLLNYVRSPLLTDTRVSFDGFEAYDVESLSIGDLFAERPIVVHGKYKNARGSIIVKGNTPHKKYIKRINVNKSYENPDNVALEYLWARERIARLSDYAAAGEQNKHEITRLGLQYHLMTNYTSFVAVDSQKRNTGEIATVKQPLPLPEGVSNLAVAQCTRPLIPTALIETDGCAGYRRKAAFEKEALKNERAGRKIVVTGAKSTGAITIFEAENTYIIPIRAELETAFVRVKLSGATVELSIKNGVIVSAKIIKSKGARCKPGFLELVFRKIKLPYNFSGTVTLELKYI